MVVRVACKCDDPRGQLPHPLSPAALLAASWLLRLLSRSGGKLASDCADLHAQPSNTPLDVLMAACILCRFMLTHLDNLLVSSLDLRLRPLLLFRVRSRSAFSLGSLPVGIGVCHRTSSQPAPVSTCRALGLPSSSEGIACTRFCPRISPPGGRRHRQTEQAAEADQGHSHDSGCRTPIGGAAPPRKPCLLRDLERDFSAPPGLPRSPDGGVRCGGRRPGRGADDEPLARRFCLRLLRATPPLVPPTAAAAASSSSRSASSSRGVRDRLERVDARGADLVEPILRRRLCWRCRPAPVEADAWASCWSSSPVSTRWLRRAAAPARPVDPPATPGAGRETVMPLTPCLAALASRSCWIRASSSCSRSSRERPPSPSDDTSESGVPSRREDDERGWW
jgi:hypothetical protein